MGITDLLSRNPDSDPEPEENFTEQFVICFLNSFNERKNSILKETTEQFAFIDSYLSRHKKASAKLKLEGETIGPDNKTKIGLTEASTEIFKRINILNRSKLKETEIKPIKKVDISAPNKLVQKQKEQTTETKNKQGHSNFVFPSEQLLNSQISKSKISSFKTSNSNLPKMSSTKSNNDDISFVGRDSPSTYLEILYWRQRDMEVYRPRKLKQGQTLNMEDKQWEKEYKLLCHRINYMERVVNTGKDFPDPEVRNREPLVANPAFRTITVDQENSKNAWGRAIFQRSGLRYTN